MKWIEVWFIFLLQCGDSGQFAEPVACYAEVKAERCFSASGDCFLRSARNGFSGPQMVL
jgi:hypothetical protein